MTIRIDRVVTRGGDKGETSLASGERVKKSSAVIEAIGEVDELNAFVGFVRVALGEQTVELKPILENVSQELFDLGAALSRFNSNSPLVAGQFDELTVEQCDKLTVVQFDEIFSSSKVATLEGHCKQFNKGLPQLNSFVLPGGSELACRLHLARTSCRRAERSVVKLLDQVEDGGNKTSTLLAYLNRLSDFFFILSRYVLLREGRAEILWVKESERENQS